MLGLELLVPSQDVECFKSLIRVTAFMDSKVSDQFVGFQTTARAVPSVQQVPHASGCMQPVTVLPLFHEFRPEQNAMFESLHAHNSRKKQHIMEVSQRCNVGEVHMSFG